MEYYSIKPTSVRNMRLTSQSEKRLLRALKRLRHEVVSMHLYDSLPGVKSEVDFAIHVAEEKLEDSILELPSVPDGFALVPLKLTSAMINAWSGGLTVNIDKIAYYASFQESWARILRAAQNYTQNR